MTKLTQEDCDAAYEQTFLVPCHLRCAPDGHIYAATPDIASLADKRIVVEHNGDVFDVILKPV